MKIINSITLSISLILLPLYVPSVLAEANLVAAWSFDEGSGNVAKNITSNEHAGEVKDAKWVDGKFGSALEFKGAEPSQVEVPGSPALNLTEAVTLEAWIKAKSVAGFCGLVQKWNDDGGVNKRQYLLANYNGTLRMYVSYAGIDYPGVGSKNKIPADEWTHIAGSYDGKKLRVYINGKLEGEGCDEAGQTLQSGKEIFTSDTPFWIGGYAPGMKRWFNGVVDEVMLWDAALTEEEISAIMQKSVKEVLAVEPNGKIAISWGFIKSRY
jgi:hypothetical protein